MLDPLWKEGTSQYAQKAASPSLQEGRSVGVPRGRFTKVRRLERERIRPRSYFQRRVARDAHIGATRWATTTQTPGDHALRKGRAVVRRTRRQSRGCARTLLSRCRNRQAARPKEALSPNASASKERTGIAVNGGLVCGCTIARSCRARLRRAPSNEAPHCEATRGGGSRRRRRADHRGPWCAPPTAPAWGKTADGASRPLPRVGCAIAGRKAGARAAHPLSNEGIPDCGKSERFTAIWP